ncbi:MAG: tandem-95 repeat protein, partial [Proteobacteria bacterium]|nr:tandem-95 repeat protein [Pseudomonadota bacterium]
AEFRPGHPTVLSVRAIPQTGVGIYVVEEFVPEGWTVAEIDSGGAFNVALGRVRWGPFTDDSPRTLGYSVTSPSGISGDQRFGGTVSFDGQLLATGGNATSRANGPPIISEVSDIQSIEDDPVAISFTVTDDVTRPEELRVRAFGSNPVLSPEGGWSLVRTGSTWTLRMALAPETGGDSRITLEADDGGYVTRRTFTLSVRRINDAPILYPPVAATTLEEVPVVLGSFVVADTDAGDAIVEATVTVHGGTLTFGSPGAVSWIAGAQGQSAMTLQGSLVELNRTLASSTFSPSPDFFGTASVSVRVDDLGNSGPGVPGLATASVPVEVLPVNDAPAFVVGPDIRSSNSAGATTIPGWAGSISPGASNESSQLLQFRTETAQGALFSVLPVVDLDGRLLFTPAPGAVGTATVTVRLMDDGGTSRGGRDRTADQSFLIVITDPMNQPPRLGTLVDLTVPEDAPITVSLQISDAETPAVDLRVSASSSVQTLVPDSGLQIEGAGSNRTLRILPFPEVGGRTRITLVIDDGAYQIRETFWLTVVTTNDPPRILIQQPLTTAEDTPISVSGLRISDPDAGLASMEMDLTVSSGVLRLESLGGATPIGDVTGQGSIALRGTLTQLNEALAKLVYKPASDWFGPVDVRVRVNDSGDTRSPGTETVITAWVVTAVNDAPVATAQAVTTDEDEPRAITLAGTDVEGSTLTYAVVSAPTKGVLSGTVPNLTYTPNANGSGSDSFTFKVNDGTLDSAVATVAITISAVNDAPVFPVISDWRVKEGQLLEFRLAATDLDNPIDSLAFRIVSGPAGISVVADRFSWTPSESQGGIRHVIRLAVSDGSSSTTNEFGITVSEENTPPRWNDIAPVTISENLPFELTLRAIDTDEPIQRLRYMLLDGPDGASLSEEGRFIWSPTERQGPATRTVRVAVTDGETEASASFTITVEESNQTPAFVGLEDVTLVGGVPYTQFLLGSDPDIPVQPLQFRWIEGPVGSGVTNGIFFWTPGTVSSEVIQTAALAVSDGLVSVTNRFNLRVKPSGGGPSFVGLANAVIPEQVPYR